MNKKKKDRLPIKIKVIITGYHLKCWRCESIDFFSSFMKAQVIFLSFLLSLLFFFSLFFSFLKKIRKKVMRLVFFFFSFLKPTNFFFFLLIFNPALLPLD